MGLCSHFSQSSSTAPAFRRQGRRLCRSFRIAAPYSVRSLSTALERRRCASLFGRAGLRRSEWLNGGVRPDAQRRERSTAIALPIREADRFAREGALAAPALPSGMHAAFLQSLRRLRGCAWDRRQCGCACEASFGSESATIGAHSSRAPAPRLRARLPILK